MGKGDRRRKATPPGISDLAVKPRREQPRRGGRFARADPEISNVALDARCRAFGIAPSPSAREAMRGPEAGSPIGMVLMRLCRDGAEVSRLWTVWQGWCSAERVYRSRYIGQTGDPKGASLPVLPEPLQTDQNHTVDTRTGDERDRDAVNGWMRWQGYLGHLSGARQGLLHGARNGSWTLWDNCCPTRDGFALLAALRHLADVVEGKAK